MSNFNAFCWVFTAKLLMNFLINVLRELKYLTCFSKFAQLTLSLLNMLWTFENRKILCSKWQVCLFIVLTRNILCSKWQVCLVLVLTKNLYVKVYENYEIIAPIKFDALLTFVVLTRYSRITRWLRIDLNLRCIWFFLLRTLPWNHTVDHGNIHFAPSISKNTWNND